MSNEAEIREAQAHEARRQRKQKEKLFKKKLLLVLSVIILLLALLIVLVLVLLVRARLNADAYGGAPAGEISALSIEYVGEKTTTAERETIVEPVVQEKVLPVIVTDGLVSKNAYMIRTEDDKVVFEKGAEEQIYPASMTKLMTGLLAVENLDLSMSHVVTWEEVNKAWTQDATMAGFSDGETVPINDLLYGAMLPSGAECCYALASEVIEKETGATQWNYEELFVQKMNEKAAEIGMTATRFANCTGLQQEGHYSTCKDIAMLLKYVLQNETLKKVISEHAYTSTPTPYHEKGVVLTSTMFASMGSSTLQNETSIMGGKTGFTDEAGHCLASYAKAVDETEYILVTAGAYSPVNDYTNISDAKYIYGQLPAE